MKNFIINEQEKHERNRLAFPPEKKTPNLVTRETERERNIKRDEHRRKKECMLERNKEKGKQREKKRKKYIYESMRMK